MKKRLCQRIIKTCYPVRCFIQLLRRKSLVVTFLVLRRGSGKYGRGGRRGRVQLRSRDRLRRRYRRERPNPLMLQKSRESLEMLRRKAQRCKRQIQSCRYRSDGHSERTVRDRLCLPSTLAINAKGTKAQTTLQSAPTPGSVATTSSAMHALRKTEW